MSAESVIAIIILGILALGLIPVLTWKALVTFKDKREYEKFVQETKDPDFYRVIIID